MSKIKYTTQGLSCANCASKIENEIKKLDDIEDVLVDIVHERVVIQGEQLDEKILQREIQGIIDRIEPGIKVLYNEKAEIEDHKKDFIRIIIAILLFIIGYFMESGSTLIYLVAYLLIGYDILWIAFQNILHKEFFDENFLMSIATLSAVAINEVPEAVAVMLFYQVGEYLQNKSLSYSRTSIRKLLDLKVDKVKVRVNGELVIKTAEEVMVNDELVLQKGEKLAVDGRLVSSFAQLDCSSITGESIPIDYTQGDLVYAGSINCGQSINVEVVNDYSHSTIAKTIEMIEDATLKKAKTEQFITKFAKVYTPIVVLLAILLALYITFFGSGLHDGIYRAAVFLVISCPCALVISIPLGYFAGIGRASKLGVMIKGGQYLEALSQVKTMAFDKTGTLTKGTLEIQKIENKGIEQSTFLKYIASIEEYSTHPIAKAISRQIVERVDVKNVEEYEGLGIKGTIEGITYYVGTMKWMNSLGFTCNENGIHFASAKEYYGYLTLKDEVKENAKDTIRAIKEMKIHPILLSGDTQSIVDVVSEEVGIKEAFGGLLPKDKLSHLEALKHENVGLAFIGDGINDGPALALADVGIAMGGLGSDVAIESADIVVLNDDLSHVIDAIKIAKKTRKIVLQNIIFVLLVKLIVLFLGTFGFASMWLAIFADVGVSILAILNAMRILRKNI